MAPSLTRQKKPQVRAEESSAFGPIAERFRRAGDLDRAVSLCREGLQKFPHHISARVTLGWALLDLSKYEEARTELEQVLRRAPDNLAAIRGLAELHDRAEHTLNLPMDGPGLWPPDEAAVNQAANDDQPAPENTATADEFMTLVSGDEPEFQEAGAAAGPAVHAPTVFTTSSPALHVEPGEAGVAPEPVDAVEPSAAVSEPEPPVVEIVQPWLAPPDVEAESVAEIVASQTPVVSESDIAALIAEADKLEAAAEATVVEPGLVLDASADPSAFGEAGLEEPVEASSPSNIECEPPGPMVDAVEPIVASPAAAAVAEEPALAPPASLAVEEPGIAEAMDGLDAVTAADTVAVAAAVALTDTGATSDAVAVVDAVADLDAVVDVESAAAVEEVAEPPAPEVVEPEILEPEVVAPEVVVSEVVVPDVIAPESVAAFSALAPADVASPSLAAAEPVRDSLVGLERFLRQVQARRRQLVSQSVA